MTATTQKTRKPRKPRTSRTVRSLLGLLAVLAACWGTLLLAVPAPAGDPVLVSTAPAAGEIVTSPDEVRLTFDRPVPAGLATVRMTVPGGAQVVEGRPYAVADDPNTLAVRMPPTRYAGTYSVAWSVPSPTLRPLTGTTEFHVFSPAPPTAVPRIPLDRDPLVVALYDASRAAATAAFALGPGVAFALGVAWPAGAAHAPARRTLTYACWALVLATLVTIASHGGYAARLPVAEAFDPAVVSAAFASDTGAVMLARLLVLVPVTIALLQVLAGPPPGSAAARWVRAAAVLGAAAAPAATWGLAEPHGSAGPGLVAVGTRIVLLLALGVCAGGPVLLWVLARTPGDSALRVAAPRLARLLPAAGALLLVVGPLAAAGRQVVALLVLGVLVAGSGAAAGWWAHRRARTRGRDLAGRARLRRWAAIGATGATVALLAAAGPAPVAQADDLRPASAELAR